MIKRKVIVLASVAVLAVATATSANAKPKAKGSTQLTQNDIRVCMGVDGSKPAEQIPACTKIIESGNVKPPYTGDYYATRASALFALNQLAAAKADLDKAIAFRAAPEFYFQRGTVNMALFDWAAAKSDLDNVIKLKPAMAQAHFMRGLLAYNEVELEQALSYFNAAAERIPTYYQAIFARGVVKTKLGKTSEGERDLSTARDMSKTVDEDMKKLGIMP